MQSITVQELAALGSSVPLIDVREVEEVAQVRVPWAVNLPLSSLANHLDEIPSGAYIMCRSGGRSGRTVQHLATMGREAVNVDGGILAWEAAGLPVERG